MDRIVFGGVAVALIGLGVRLVGWPAWIVSKSRDEADSRPVPSRQLLAMRAVGVGVILGGGYGLYALLTGMPGAEFLTA
jgi:hypothetical protein